ncbi:hypothetical protein AOLI_G00001050 [Acnodon oligacanthus]
MNLLNIASSTVQATFSFGGQGGCVGGSLQDRNVMLGDMDLLHRDSMWPVRTRGFEKVKHITPLMIQPWAHIHDSVCRLTASYHIYYSQPSLSRASPSLTSPPPEVLSAAARSAGWFWVSGEGKHAVPLWKRTGALVGAGRKRPWP